ncbi:Outer membrane cobalamin receptor protein, SusC/RagA family [Bacteroidales bacterium Barb4]|nr:Outer membrane cobalamin receptor protein, SusC/RagA family [Bacteroidales bacterium Barb4]
MKNQTILNAGRSMRLFAFLLLFVASAPVIYAVGAPASAQQQTKTVTGVIIDEYGDPLLGVNVSVKGQAIGTTTDMDGHFSLAVPSGNISLTISYIGFLTQHVSPAENMRIVLKEDTQNLDEIVVVGYGVQRKSDLTGSISKVDADDFKNTPVQGIESALQGRAAGVTVTSISGAPGSGTAVRVRGVGSVNDANDPLYVVDGIPVSDINYLNPSDISSIEILKDASATAIYGSRASNGVVLVTTLRGNSEGEAFRTMVKFDMYYGVQSAMNQPKMQDATGFATARRLAYINAGELEKLESEFQSSNFDNYLNNVVAKITGSTAGTNWWDESFQTGSIQNYNASVSGGNKKISYLTSASYFKNEGIIKFSNFDRLTLRSNVDFNITDRVKLSSNLSATHTTRHTVLENNLEDGVVFGAITYDPTAPVFRHGYVGLSGWEGALQGYDPNDPVSWFGNSEHSNKEQPYAVAYRQGKFRENTMLKVVGNFVLDVKIMPWLIFKSNLGLDNLNRIADEFYPSYYIAPEAKEDNNRVYKQHTQYLNWVWENTISGTKKFGNHSLSAVAGMTMESWDWTQFRGEKQGTPNNNADQWVLSAATFNPTAEGEQRHSAMMSYLGRVNYGFADRYLITASVRADGSSKFRKENRWATFPSASVGWRLSQEGFFQDWEQKVISNVKVRAGWGQIGNQMGLGNSDYMTTITGGDDKKYLFGSNKNQKTGYSPDRIGNPNIQWETSEQLNFGADLGFFDNHLTAGIDYFRKDTRDMLVQVPLPSYLGYQNDPWVNQGQVRNSGVEVQLDWQDKVRDITYGISGNLTTMKNEVISLGGGRPIPGGNERPGDVTLTKEGWAIGSFYGWQVDGVFQDQKQIDNSHMKNLNPRPGDFIFKDTDGNGKLDDDDRVNLGSPLPKVAYGLNLNAAYKGIDLTLFFQGQAGNKIFRMFKYYTHRKDGYFNTYSDLVEQSWRAPGTLGTNDPGVASNTEFAFNTSTALNMQISDYYVEDGSYLRLKNIQLGYTLPKKLLSPLNITNLRIYTSIQNLFTITKYKGLEPELGGNDNGNPTDFGIDRSTYPQARTVMFGLGLTL